MSANVTNIADKLSMLKARSTKIKAVELAAEKKVTFEEEGPQSGRCFPRLLSCIPTRHRVYTSDSLQSSTSSHSKIHARFFGISKQQKSDALAIESAMAKVQQRVTELEQRASVHRSLALREKKEGRTPDALRELKKAKNVEKQLDAARSGLDALERQLDTLSDIGLQKELATALTATSKSLKGKTKGLVELADGAIELTQELQDDADDISQAFEGLGPANGSKFEDDDLLAELDEMMGLGDEDEQQEQQSQQSQLHPTSKASQPRMLPSMVRKKQSRSTSADMEADDDDEVATRSFPSAPTGAVDAVCGGHLAADNVGVSVARRLRTRNPERSELF